MLNASYKKLLLFSLRLIVPILFFTFLYKKKDLFNQIVNGFIGFNWNYGLLAFSLFFIAQLFSVFRLLALIKSTGRSPTFMQLAGDHFACMALNTLTITLTGDSYKMYKLSERNNIKMSQSIQFILIDRIIGIITLITLSVSAYFLADLSPIEEIHFLQNKLIISLLLTFTLLIVFIFLKQTQTSIVIRLKNLLSHRIDKLVYMYSLVSSFLVLLCILFIFSGLNLNPPILLFIFLIPVCMILSMLPISFGGLGIRESSYVILLSLIDLDKALGVNIGLIQYSYFLIFAAVGVIVLLTRSLNGKKIANA